LRVENVKRLTELKPEQRQRLRQATAMNRQVLESLHRGQPQKAVALAEEMLKVRRELLGEDHPGYATGLNNLAGLYHDMGDYPRPLPLYQQALAVYKKTLGEDHPDYATSLSTL